jgi:hypothetical protein
MYVVAFEGDNHVEWSECNFEAYEEDKRRRLGADSLIPTRIKRQKFETLIELSPNANHRTGR